MIKMLIVKWNAFINRIAEQNKKNYGSGGINCCELKDVNEPK
jgi:hypothetical protein